MREVVLHALRLRNSVGTFAVVIPQQYEQDTEVPCTIQTVSFVLAAVHIQLPYVSMY